MFKELYQLTNSIKVGNIKIPTVTEGSGLYKDAYEKGRYIYKGGEPNNYITFNNESWRILSVEADGKIKIVRNEALPNKSFDETDSNNWARPATLNTYLNKQVTIDEKSRTWNGKVGLITASEYIRASNNSACKSNKDYYNNSSCYINSIKHNWLHFGSNCWTLSPNFGTSYEVLDISNDAHLRTAFAEESSRVRPAIFLSSNLTLTGSGTVGDPYKIA